jgi:hypothetical protein
MPFFLAVNFQIVGLRKPPQKDARTSEKPVTLQDGPPGAASRHYHAQQNPCTFLQPNANHLHYQPIKLWLIFHEKKKCDLN